MARFTGTVRSPHPAADTWSYLADLRSIAEWDPSVERISLSSGEPRTVDARYELAVSFLGKTLTLPYATVAAEEPTRVVFAAWTDIVTVRDEARVRPLPDGGSSVTWDAELRLRGARRLLNPLLRLAFGRLGDRAERGLRKRLNEGALSRPRERVMA